jgi:glucokinase
MNNPAMTRTDEATPAKSGADPRNSPGEFIGVDLGGTKMAVGVLDRDRRVLYRSTAPSVGLHQNEVLATLERELQAALAARPDAAAIGLGIPATIDRARGVAINAVNLDLVDVPIRDIVSEQIGLPAFVDNDGNVAALAEHRFGAARGATDVVLLTIGTGIGGGLILEDRPYRGSTGAGAELGHIVIDKDGPRCQGNCPNHGCVEALASGHALARDGAAAAEHEPDSALGRLLAAGEPIDGKSVTDAALAGDRLAREVVATIGRNLGVALASLANIFDPDVIVIGGGVSVVGELMLGPARDELRGRALPPMNERPVRGAELGPDAGMIGAAALADLELSERP